MHSAKRPKDYLRLHALHEKRSIHVRRRFATKPDTGRKTHDARRALRALSICIVSTIFQFSPCVERRSATRVASRHGRAAGGMSSRRFMTYVSMRVIGRWRFSSISLLTAFVLPAFEMHHLETVCLCAHAGAVHPASRKRDHSGIIT
jgi:hypothetical protein